MKFQSKNTRATGRPKGSLNKSSIAIKESFQLLLEDNLEQLRKDFQEIDNPKDRIKLFIDLAGFILPKMKQVAMEVEVQKPQDIIFNLKELYAKNEKEI